MNAQNSLDDRFMGLSSGLRSQFLQANSPLFVIRNGRVCSVNEAFCQWVSGDAQAILGRQTESFVGHADWEEVRQQLDQLLRGDQSSCQFDCSFDGLDDRSRKAFVTAVKLYGDHDGAVLCGVVDLDVQRSLDRESDQMPWQLLSFERLLSTLSASFINSPIDQIEDQINESLKSLVQFLGNDRCTFFEFGDDEARINVTHSYAVQGCPRFPIGTFEVAQLPWFINEFREGNCIFAKSIPDDLPPEAEREARYCQEHGIQSNVAVPLRAGGQVLGGLTFAFIEKPCSWPRETVLRLQLIGEVFAGSLLRRRTEMSLRDKIAENEQLRRRLEQENLYLREQTVLRHHHGKIVGRSDAILKVLADVERVATFDAPVLLTGETGTGKELLAQAIHELSSRSGSPMIVVNCASLPATLIESELFGRVAGAYTGAASAQIGRFELADGSTLFLDEIGEFPLELQAKLLRVLQDGKFERLGSPDSVAVNVRIIAATNRNLQQASRDGKFRTDLFHRLNVFPIRVPPLRERRDDIPSLAWSFVETFGRRMGKTIKSIPRKSMQRLQRHDWPGNVRELSNAIERAMILTDGDTLNLVMDDWGAERPSRRLSLKESEKQQILDVLQETGWRIRGNGGAAELLDVKPTTLEARMARLGIRRPGNRSDDS
ncbi:sigma 54-interacting transcriptional regulator [Crateriforma conspicua]|uniref:Formate hydrogenlyase transcriptional activator n=1 Tax=Crateriforma conspicua TaxID=2527996 RepID=A0A5C6FS91_9PLAN|nr:sigma 54-interacting transcriptional regulator [Crateriforma conspicua]TWU66032.1 Formate hydrogenlyase transcriptional activator [Crateriforma conspicua]